MYKALNCIIRRNHQLFDYLNNMSHLTCNLDNAALNGSANIMRKAFPLLATNINFESITTICNVYTVLN